MLFEILVFFSIYWSISTFFFFFPTLLHKKKQISKINNVAISEKKVLLIAHRGGSRENLENTIQSFQNAYDLKCNVMEMDLCLTKDKKIVVIHDSLLKRMTGVNRHVEEYDYKDLPPIMDTVLIDFTVHQKFDTTIATHRYFPLLEEVLQKFPDIHLNVEIKTPTDEFLGLLNAILKKYNRSNSIVWGCRPPVYNKKINEVNPQIQRWFNEVNVVKTYFLFMLGLLPFFPLNENQFQVPLYTSEFHEWKKREAHTLQQKVQVFGMFSLIYIWTKLGKFIFKHLEKRGIVTYLWVLNTIAEYDQALELGAHGIMTDSPTMLKKYLIVKGKFIENKDIIN